MPGEGGQVAQRSSEEEVNVGQDHQAAELAGGAPLEQVQPAGATVLYMP